MRRQRQQVSAYSEVYGVFAVTSNAGSDVKKRGQTFRISLTNPNDPIVNPIPAHSLISSWISLRLNMGKAHGGS